MRKVIVAAFLIFSNHIYCFYDGSTEVLQEDNAAKAVLVQEQVSEPPSNSNLPYLLILLISVPATIVLVVLLRKNKKSHQELLAYNEELQRTQKLLITSEKMASLGVMAAGVAHEINNPLNFIKNGVEAMDMRITSDNPKEREDLEPLFAIIHEGVSRAANIVKSLSHFSRGNPRMDETCNIKEIIENCLLILHNKIKNRVRILTEFSDGSIVKGNEGRLHQSMLNILANASQAIDGTGTIKIKTRINESVLEILIEDDGEGIPEENLDKIRDPFFTTKDPGEGTGLGLFITNTIIDEHDGSIDVISNVGKGTIFIISLPLYKD